MRVAVVYHFFPHYRAGIAKELLGSEQDHYLLVGDCRDLNTGIKVFQPADRTRFIRTRCYSVGSNFVIQMGIIRLALKRNLDAIIFLGNPYHILTWPSAAIARLTGKRVLFWTHGWTKDDSGLKAFFRVAFYRIAHALLLYGNGAKSIGLAKGFSRNRLYVIYNSLDYEMQKEVRSSVDESSLTALRHQLFSYPDRPMVICTARLTIACRFDLLLDALEELRTEGHEINALLVGDGPERLPLEAEIARRGLTVKIYDPCYEEIELARLIMAANMAVSP